jgi:cytochrome c5
MTPRILAISFVVLFLCLFARAAVDAAHSDSRANSQTSNNTAHPAPADAGEQIFEANCARCHMPPMTLPQRITGTVVMHMRVRARLSRQDEKLLLHYLAP